MSAIKLRKAVSPYRCGDTLGIRVRIECTTTSGLTSKIFAYRPIEVEDPMQPSGAFNHVCNVLDLIECPEDVVPEGKWPRWYRMNYIDILLPNVDMAYDFIDKVEEEVADLYNKMKMYNILISHNENDFIVGEPTEQFEDFISLGDANE